MKRRRCVKFTQLHHMKLASKILIMQHSSPHYLEPKHRRIFLRTSSRVKLEAQAIVYTLPRRFPPDWIVSIRFQERAWPFLGNILSFPPCPAASVPSRRSGSIDAITRGQIYSRLSDRTESGTSASQRLVTNKERLYCSPHRGDSRGSIECSI